MCVGCQWVDALVRFRFLVLRLFYCRLVCQKSLTFVLLLAPQQATAAVIEETVVTPLSAIDADEPAPMTRKTLRSAPKKESFTGAAALNAVGLLSRTMRGLIVDNDVSW